MVLEHFPQLNTQALPTRNGGPERPDSDSFSDGGQFDSVEAAVERGMEMLEAGASIIDVGGESTRPEESTTERGHPMWLWKRKKKSYRSFDGMAEQGAECISIDTWKAEVAEAALDAGSALKTM